MLNLHANLVFCISDSICVIQHLMCAGLWCLVEGESSCKTKLDPPLDGTECGADKAGLSHLNTITAPQQQM